MKKKSVPVEKKNFVSCVVKNVTKSVQEITFVCDECKKEFTTEYSADSHWAEDHAVDDEFDSNDGTVLLFSDKDKFVKYFDVFSRGDISENDWEGPGWYHHTSYSYDENVDEAIVLIDDHLDELKERANSLLAEIKTIKKEIKARSKK